MFQGLIRRITYGLGLPGLVAEVGERERAALRSNGHRHIDTRDKVDFGQRLLEMHFL